MGMMAMGILGLVTSIAGMAMGGGGASAPPAPPPPAPPPPPPNTDDIDIQKAKNDEERRRGLAENTLSKDNTNNSLSKTDTLGRTSNIVDAMGDNNNGRTNNNQRT